MRDLSILKPWAKGNAPRGGHNPSAAINPRPVLVLSPILFLLAACASGPERVGSLCPTPRFVAELSQWQESLPAPQGVERARAFATPVRVTGTCVPAGEQIQVAVVIEVQAGATRLPEESGRDMTLPVFAAALDPSDRRRLLDRQEVALPLRFSPTGNGTVPPVLARANLTLTLPRALAPAAQLLVGFADPRAAAAAGPPPDVRGLLTNKP